MAYHKYGDEWFERNGKDLDEAIVYCVDFWRRWGRISSHGKEKYGTFRDHIHLWDGGLYSLLFPSEVFIRPRWRFLYYTLDLQFVLPFSRRVGIRRLIHWYQAQIYNYAIQKMCKKFPNLVEELVHGLDGRSMVRPGIFGPINGDVVALCHVDSRIPLGKT